jgi:hypothetical protein
MSNTTQGDVHFLTEFGDDVAHTSGYDATQGAVVEVTGIVTRLVPCAEHAKRATGESIIDRGIVWQNPNGYNHFCVDCKLTPTTQEELEA